MADFLRLICMAIQNSQAIPKQEEGKQVDKIFTGSADVIFAFHGYVRIIHDLVHGFRSGIKNASHVVDMFEQKLEQHHHYIRQYLDDMPEIKNWKWS